MQYGYPVLIVCGSFVGVCLKGSCAPLGRLPEGVPVSDKLCPIRARSRKHQPTTDGPPAVPQVWPVPPGHATRPAAARPRPHQAALRRVPGQAGKVPFSSGSVNGAKFEIALCLHLNCVGVLDVALECSVAFHSLYNVVRRFGMSGICHIIFNCQWR